MTIILYQEEMKNILKLKTKDNTPEGIVVYAVTDEEKPRLLVIKEYRYPLDEYIYELPAGIIDPGEVAEQSAVREIKEETGFDLKVYKGGNEAFRRPFIWDLVLQMSQMAQSLEQFTLKKWSNSLKVPSAYRLCWQIRSR